MTDSNNWAVVQYVGDKEEIVAYFSSFDRASAACSKLCNTIPETAFGFFDVDSQAGWLDLIDIPFDECPPEIYKSEAHKFFGGTNNV